ncbi:MAG: hypothetical protein WDW38_004040 [Sanguina aurantia]
MVYLQKPSSMFLVVTALVCLIGVPIVSVPAGHIGVVDFFGFVPLQTLQSGIRMKTLFATMHAFSVKTKLLEVTLNVPTSEGLIVDLDISVLYHVRPLEVRDLYVTLGVNFEQVLVVPEVTSTVRSLTGRSSAKALYSSGRDELGDAIGKQLNEKLNKRGIEVEQALLRKIILPALVVGAIEEKLKAEQESQRMEFVLTKEKQEADRKRIEAQGVADFQKIVSTGISSALLEWKGIEATERLANSHNAKIVVIGNSKNGLPLILGDGGQTVSA